MALLLKQSTAYTFRLGPFVDSSDGFTAETALTITSADVLLSKAGAAFAAKNDATAGSHDTNGWYSIVLNATDTNTVGTLDIQVNETGALPVFKSFMVVPAQVYDSLVGGTDVLQVDVSQFGNAAGTFSGGRPEVNASHAGGTAWASGAITAAVFAADAITAAKVAADVGTEIGTAVWATTTRVLTAGTNIVLSKGTGVTGFNDLSAAQVNAEADTALSDVGLTSTVTGRIDVAISTRLAAASYTAPLDAAGTRSAIGLASANLDTQLATIGGDIGGFWTAFNGGTSSPAFTGGTQTFIQAMDAKATPATAADAVWDEAIAGHVTAGTFGDTVQNGASPSAIAAAVWDEAAAGHVTSGSFGAVVQSGTSAASVAAAVWDEAIASHSGLSGSVAETLAFVASQVDTTIPAAIADVPDLVWATSLPGAYTAGMAGKIIGDNLNATVSSRATQTSVDDLPTNSELATALAAADDAVLAAIAALNNLSAAQVNAEVVDALSTDTYAEPGQAAPPATASLATKVNYLYKAWRNKHTQTATDYKLFADDGATVDQKTTVSDDGTTFTRGEIATGP